MATRQKKPMRFFSLHTRWEEQLGPSDRTPCGFPTCCNRLLESSPGSEDSSEAQIVSTCKEFKGVYHEYTGN